MLTLTMEVPVYLVLKNKAEGYELQARASVQTFSHSLRSLISIVLFSLSLRRQTHTVR